ncbi:anthranilate synthase component I family protein [Cytophagales bacterium EPR-FJ-38]
MTKSYSTSDSNFWKKACYWANHNHPCFGFYNGHGIEYPHKSFPKVLMAGKACNINPDLPSFPQLQKFIDKGIHLAGFFGYDLKNELEDLESENPSYHSFPKLFFFEAEVIVSVKSDFVEITSSHPDEVFESILAQSIPFTQSKIAEVSMNMSRTEYLEKVEKIRQHILEGDFYELNFCIEFSSIAQAFDPIQAYWQLSKESPMPFSCLLKMELDYLVCASPERFLKYENGKLISQPIKGTIRRGNDNTEDETLKKQLQESEKEIAENMMIVDLVRNDLTRSSILGSIEAEELFKIYSFDQVHQMISTITSRLSPDRSPLEAIELAFPMGSMTGAPKIMAMKMIEHYENAKRSIFSGAAGFFLPNGNFDFNVIIRSIYYSSESQKISWQAGSAITWDSVAEQEYEECLLKTRSIQKILDVKIKED